MKKALLVAVLGAVVGGSSFGQIIGQWNFESPFAVSNTGVSPLPSGGSLSADIGSGTASALHATAGTAWSNPAGNGTSQSLSSNNWTLGDYYQFQVSTVGLSGIFLAWSQTGSNTGPKGFTLQYSTDGTTFTDFTTYTLTNGAWTGPSSYKTANLYTYDLSAVTALNNAATAYFRLMDNSTVAINSANPVATTGSGRVDQFTVSQGFVDITITPVPEPGTVALVGLGLGVVLFGVRRRRLA